MGGPQTDDGPQALSGPPSAGPGVLLDAVDRALTAVRDTQEDVATGGPGPYEDTVARIDAAWGTAAAFVDEARHRDSVSSAAWLRSAVDVAQARLDEARADMLQHQGLWRALRSVVPGDGADAHLRTHRLIRLRREFQHAGATADVATRTRVRTLQGELQRATLAFADDLAAGPSPAAVATTLRSAATRADREAIWSAFHARAHDREPLCLDILRLRRERARAVGRPSFTALALSGRMLSSRARIQRWLDPVLAALRGRGPSPLAPWELGAPGPGGGAEDGDLDPRAATFDLGHLLAAAPDFLARCLGLPTSPSAIGVEDPASESLEPGRVFSTVDGRACHVYLDLRARPSKRPGAWTTTVERPGGPHHVHVCCSLPPRISHRELRTVLHELGHAAHAVTRLLSSPFVGLQEPWDRIEAPALSFERASWDARVLETLTGHALAPDALRRARRHTLGTPLLRQTATAALDLELHSSFDPDTDGSPLAWARRRLSELEGSARDERDSSIATLGHLFARSHGYAAGYYAYPIAHALASQLVPARSRGDDVTTRLVATNSALWTLDAGTRPLASIRRFLGHAPGPGALLEEIIAPTNEPN